MTLEKTPFFGGKRYLREELLTVVKEILITAQSDPSDISENKVIIKPVRHHLRLSIVIPRLQEHLLL